MGNMILDNIAIHFEDTPFMENLHLQLQRGKILTLVGPNGSGKSTLLKTMGRILKPAEGQVFLDGKSIARLPTKEVARQMALLPQKTQSPEQFRVLDLVRLGRYPHQSLWKRNTAKDEEIVHRALTQMDLLPWIHQEVHHLSGGQQQRAWIAMALAQDTPYLLLDEPTTFLDIAHQLEILELLKMLNEQHGKTIIMVLHDVNLAARYSHELILLKEGSVVAQGAPLEVLTPERFQEIFNIQVHCVKDPITNTPYFIPVSSSYSPLSPTLSHEGRGGRREEEEG